MREYAKAVVALVFAAATVAASAVTDGTITIIEWIEIAIAGLTAGGVWLNANLPGYQTAKTNVAAALAGLNFLTGAVTDGMTTAEWINFGLAFAGTVFVWAVPNQPTPQPTADAPESR